MSKQKIRHRIVEHRKGHEVWYEIEVKHWFGWRPMWFYQVDFYFPMDDKVYPFQMCFTSPNEAQSLLADYHGCTYQGKEIRPCLDCQWGKWRVKYFYRYQRKGKVCIKMGTMSEVKDFIDNRELRNKETKIIIKKIP